MANKPISEDNPFANLSDVQCEQIQNWYQKHISLTLPLKDISGGLSIITTKVVITLC